MTKAAATISSASDDRARIRAEFDRFAAARSLQRPSDLILIQPALVPQSYFDVTTARSGGYYNFPPVGLLYLAAAARAADPALGIHLIDINHQLLKAAHGEAFDYGLWRDLVRDAIKACAHPHVGVSYMFGTTKPCFTEVIDLIRSEFPQVPILCGGVQATFDYREILASGLCDIVARHEGEQQLIGYLGALAGNPDAVPVGMAFTEAGAIVELGTPPPDNPVNWDVTPFYDAIRIEEYHRYGGLGAFSRYVGADKPFATVLAARGCRARCTFCTVRNFNGFGLRQRTVQDVIDEVKHLVTDHGIRSIDWLDDDLLWDRDRALALFRGLAEQVPGLEWTASNGLIAVAIDDEMMQAMVASGLRAFKIGVESGNDAMLKTIKKPTTKPKLRARAGLFAKYPDVFVSTNFIIGFPDETFGQMMDSYDLAVELASDWASFYICQPLKGTEMFSAFQSLGDARTKEERYDKTINPGRSAERGEFGYRFAPDRVLRTGWEVFEIDRNGVPDLEQQKEIWFSFNLVANFLDNPNFRPGGNAAKLARWIEAIHDGYPYDASMAAALAHAYHLLGNANRHAHHRADFLRLTATSAYWQNRVAQFPELLVLAHLEQPPDWFAGPMPRGLTRPLPQPQRQQVHA
ncbi:Radical SAM domain protein [Rhodopseudomonas palustris TIE-1]|uniref:B12-binding domain-containing radical SAM protein n=1 Tax=Rhodopseudomonas palustris TaxID=1076 RepID=UPI00017797A4|nr:radical SAM protein [Rhodopseudomonas palustris]ACF02564.1 Radical SAM domain protein [Rhodopseudomonas palustris TIE-1]